MDVTRRYTLSDINYIYMSPDAGKMDSSVTRYNMDVRSAYSFLGQVLLLIGKKLREL